MVNEITYKTFTSTLLKIPLTIWSYQILSFHIYLEFPTPLQHDPETKKKHFSIKPVVKMGCVL
jgi:hypothetical protein